MKRKVNKPWQWLVWIALVFAMLTFVFSLVAYCFFDRAPGELMRYAERRLQGHTKLEWVSKPVFGLLRPVIEREVGAVEMMNGVGPMSVRLPPVRYDRLGRPLASDQPALRDTMEASQGRLVAVTSTEDFLQAMAKARSGDVIELQPGTYALSQRVRTPRGGTPTQPIVVRASRPGGALIESSAVAGILVNQPYWVFEDLVIQGICKVDADCEHAFHVVGPAMGTVIRNNVIKGFNAHVKINGLPSGQWPDHGLIERNVLRNDGPRQTTNPVAFIDLVGANGWRVTHNYIAHFIKLGGNHVAYGAFMKGAGRDGVMEGNHIVCTEHNISQPGVRVGASFGGGGTGAKYCRDGRCITEFSHGVLSNNRIEHCNDFGVYINQSNQIHIEGNEILNTYGVDVRFPESSVILKNNRIDGRVRSREGGVIHQ